MKTNTRFKKGQIPYNKGKSKYMDKISRKSLLNLYKQGKYMCEIGKYFNVTEHVIYRLSRMYKFPRRKRPSSRHKFLSKSILYKFHLEKCMSINKIHRVLKVGSDLIRYYMNYHNIPIRKYNKKNYIKLNIKQLIKLYKKGLSLEKIGKLLNCSTDIIRYRLLKSKIRLRKSGFKKGKLSNSWKGGPYKDGYYNRYCDASYDKFILEIKKRDNFKCKICNSTHKIEVHHIKPFAEYPKLAKDPNNCITLCQKCHNKTRANREKKFEKFFRILINKK